MKLRIELIYYLLLANYSNSVIASSDENRFKYNVFSIIFQYGPSWQKELDIQKELRKLNVEDFQMGTKNIVNNAQNPSSEPSTSSLEELLYINQQNTSTTKRSKADGYALMLSLLKEDVSAEFIARFKKLFLTIVEPEKPLWYGTYGEDADISGNTYIGESLYGNFRSRYFSQIFPDLETFKAQWEATEFNKYLMED